MKVKVTCAFCGAEIERNAGRVALYNFCSAKCRVAWHRQQKGYPTDEHTCERCGKTFKRTKGYKPKELICDDCQASLRMEATASKIAMRICEDCGKEFRPLSAGERKHYRCPDCKAKRRAARIAPKEPEVVSVKCAWCGKPLKRQKRYVRERNYCSEACRHRDKYAEAKRRSMTLLVCEHCGKIFEAPEHQVQEHNYCSKECRAARVVTLQCDYCGKTFERKARYVHGHNYCSKECRSAASRPDRKIHRTLTEEQREAIRERNRNFDWSNGARERAREAQLARGEAREAFRSRVCEA